METQKKLPPVIVAHVGKGYEDRARHMERMLGDAGLDFSFMLAGNKSDLTEEVLDKWFTDFMKKASAQTSCAYKHLLICKKIVDDNLPGALVMEDDAVIFPKFTTLLPKALEQLESRGDEPALLSLEDSRLRFVPRSMRRKGWYVYPGDRDRFTGCYYLNRAGAEAILCYASSHKVARPIDHFHRLMLDEGLLKYYWMQPVIATQGSCTGMFQTTLSSARFGFIYPLKWKLKLAYRKMLYFFR